MLLCFDVFLRLGGEFSGTCIYFCLFISATFCVAVVVLTAVVSLSFVGASWLVPLLVECVGKLAPDHPSAPHVQGMGQV